jgi:hypothetical protein
VKLVATIVFIATMKIRREDVLTVLAFGTNEDALVDRVGTSRREEMMSALVAKNLEIMDSRKWKFQIGNRSLVVRDSVERMSKIILLAKDFVSSAVGTDPHAALAWAGTSAILPVSSLHFVSSFL